MNSQEEVRGCKGKYEEVLDKGRGARYLKLTFKYELDTKEGPSCFYNLASKLTCS